MAYAPKRLAQFVAPNAETTMFRFWDKVSVGDDCWEWQGALNPDGYGMFRVGGRKTSPKWAHRVAHELWIGPIPDGYEVDHLCTNPRCVRPKHLEAVTPAENRRRVEERRSPYCPAGHLYDNANSYFDPKGHRRCHECRRALQRLRYVSHPVERATHCVNGHERVGENVLGNRGCRQCGRDRAREYQRRKRSVS